LYNNHHKKNKSC